MALKKRELGVLRRYLEGESPGDSGEWGMHCPFHDDATRSASLNVTKRKWYCQVCEIGGNVSTLLASLPPEEPEVEDGPMVAGFIDFDDSIYQAQESRKNGSSKGGGDAFSEGSVAGWHAALLASGAPLAELKARRGLDLETLVRFEIGWDSSSRAYTIPVRDFEGSLVNIRRYQLDPPDGRRKIWSVAGHGSPVLYPINILDDASEIVVCEGEWDALLTIQNGFPAITRTGAAKVWRSNWNHLFSDKVVYVCHDRDPAGEEGTRKVVAALKDVAAEVRAVELPYKLDPKHGKDLTDYWLDGYTAHDFKELLGESQGVRRDPAVVEREFVDVGVLDSFSAEQAGRRLRMRVTITGKKSPTYLLPQEVTYTCSQDAGAKCLVCPMNDLGGLARRHVGSHDPVVLEMMDASKRQVADILREHLGAQKCNRLEIDMGDMRSVEELYVRPSVEFSSSSFSGSSDYTNRRIISVGRHDSMPNNTVEIVGTVVPNPRTQHNEFQAWEVVRTETSIDRYEVTEQGVDLMTKFQVARGQRPLKKIGEISRDYARHVTKIYGRPEMHAMYDLVYHSVLQFEFGGTVLQRGWLEALVVGDTRTGKSEVADKLRSHLGAGEMVSCESASFAGIVGGLQQLGGNSWEVTWGAIPLNDRRLVVLDEVSGLTYDQIGQMSSIRSSGEAQLTKIRSERTYARTRLIWMGNPRNGRMSDYTYGVQAILPLIGQNEDVARFDMAMSVSADEVEAAEINRQHHEDAPQMYDSESCRELLNWVWSRKPENVVWEAGAQDAVYAHAIAMGQRYVEVPPLVQAANIRVKIARLAVAMAARTFSTDKSFECVVVKKVHVEDAVKFLDLLYSKSGFGYHEVSREVLADIAEASAHYDEAKQYLIGNKGLAKFLRSMGSYRRQDMEDMMNMTKEEANATIGTLWKYRMIRRQGPDIKIQPLLHELLREVRE